MRVTDDRIVAVGLLTARDLEGFGRGFARRLPLADDASFAALVAELDGFPAPRDAEAAFDRASAMNERP